MHYFFYIISEGFSCTYKITGVWAESTFSCVDKNVAQLMRIKNNTQFPIIRNGPTFANLF